MSQYEKNPFVKSSSLLRIRIRHFLVLPTSFLEIRKVKCEVISLENTIQAPKHTYIHIMHTLKTNTHV